MFAASCNLKHYKRENILANSTKSCTINLNTLEAWSYGEKIAYVFGKNREFVIFNITKFSQTTSTHQGTVFYESCYNGLKKFSIDIDSLNNFNGKKDSLELDKINYINDDTLELFKLLKVSKKDIQALKDRLEKREIERKKAKSMERKLEKFRKLDYARPEKLEQVYDELKDYFSSWRMAINAVSENKIKKHINFLNKFKNDLILSSQVSELLEKINNLSTFNKLGD